MFGLLPNHEIIDGLICVKLISLDALRVWCVCEEGVGRGELNGGGRESAHTCTTV